MELRSKNRPAIRHEGGFGSSPLWLEAMRETRSTSLNILIAEDEPTIASILESLVEEKGHHICGIVDQGAAVLGKR